MKDAWTDGVLVGLVERYLPQMEAAATEAGLVQGLQVPFTVRLRFQCWMGRSGTGELLLDDVELVEAS